MPRREKYVPKHRDAPPAPALKKGLRKTVVFSGVAVAATGVAVSSGIAIDSQAATTGSGASLAAPPLSRSPVRSDQGGSAPSSQAADDYLRGRVDLTSRSAERTPLDPSKEQTLDQESGGQVTHTENLTSQDPKTIARALLPEYGFSSSEFSCLDSLYTRESGWDVHADNPTSDAYGIPQALPGSKMASAGSDWANDASTQIKWGLEYIRSRYGTPCAAWGYELSHGYY